MKPVLHHDCIQSVQSPREEYTEFFRFDSEEDNKGSSQSSSSVDCVEVQEKSPMTDNGGSIVGSSGQIK